MLSVAPLPLGGIYGIGPVVVTTTIESDVINRPGVPGCSDVRQGPWHVTRMDPFEIVRLGGDLRNRRVIVKAEGHRHMGISPWKTTFAGGSGVA